MAFIQIIDTRTTRFEDVQKLGERWRRETEGKRTLRREIVCRDRNDPDRYITLAFFDSHESAMRNSALPETQAASVEYEALTDGLTFVDLDVLEDVAR